MATNNTKDEALRRIYRDPSNPGAFAGVKALYREAKRQGHKVNEKYVKEFLEGEDPYTLHARVVRARKNVMNERVMTGGPYDLWEADLMEPTKPRGTTPAIQRTKIKFWLVVIDAFTRFAWVEKLENKTATSMIAALTRILDRGLPAHAKLNHLRTDQGTEFMARPVRAFLRERGINHYIAQKEPGAALAERFIRTLGAKYERYVTSNPSATKQQLMNKLPQFVEGYNASEHSSVKHPPADLQAAAYRLGSKSSEAIVEALQRDPTDGEEDSKLLNEAHRLSHTPAGRYKDPNPLNPVNGPRAEAPLKKGQNVRVLVRKHIFEKGRKKNFSEEIWRIKETKAGGNPNSYQLEDDKGEEMIGKVYRRFLQPVRRSGVYEVEVVRRRGNYILVRWVGYDQTTPEPQWIHKNSLVGRR